MDSLIHDVDDLANLLAAGPEPGPSTKAQTHAGGVPVNPGMIGAAHPRPKKKYNLYDFDRKPVLEKDIWTDDDVEDICYDDAADPRQCPEYTITYRQRVCSEDIFLGMMGKQNSIEDCNEMVMHVEMPLAVALSDIQVDIKDNCVWVQCPQYKLRADLPVKVDEADSTARWDAVDKRLILTMPIVREFKI